jgi:hypothetical protein
VRQRKRDGEAAVDIAGQFVMGLKALRQADKVVVYVYVLSVACCVGLSDRFTRGVDDF